MSTTTATTVTLNTPNGATMPVIGLGTWRSPDEQVSAAVEVALRHGIRHIDGAWAYDNERSVGQGIRASGVPREEIFVTTKLWSTYHRRVEQGLDESLRNLGLDYVDLYLVHWPIALVDRNNEKIPLRSDGSRDIDEQRPLHETWRDMEKLLDTGKVRAIGVSNVSQAAMEQLLSTARIVPAANQIESHPYLPEHDLVAYLKRKSIVPQAYSPLGSGAADVLQDETLLRIAHAHNVDAANIAISWQAQRGVVSLPKSVTESRIISNSKVVTLTDAEMQEINQLYTAPGKHIRTCTPPWGVDLQFPFYPVGEKK